MQPQEECSDSPQDTLGRIGVKAVVIGALAALEYRSTERFTADIDLLVDRIDNVQGALEQEGYKVQPVRDPEGRLFLLRATRGLERVDLLLAETEYQQEALRRSVTGYLTVEDVIVHKLIAWRERDKDDIHSIFEVGHSLDREYIEHWAVEWGVEERWQQAQTWLP